MAETNPAYIVFSTADVTKVGMLPNANTWTGVNTFNGVKLNVRTVTDSTTLAVTDDVLICNKPTAMTVTLLAATATEQHFYIKNVGAGVVTVARAGSDTIDGETSQTLSQHECLEIIDRVAGDWGIL